MGFSLTGLSPFYLQTEREETLDDSLTNLQWLWNLNVNISNPIHDIGIHPTSNHTKRDMFPIKNHSKSFLPEKQIKAAAIQFHNNNRAQLASAGLNKKRNEFVHPYQKQNSRALPSGLVKTDFDAIKSLSSGNRKFTNTQPTDSTPKISRYGGHADVKPKKTSPPSNAKMIKTTGQQKNNDNDSAEDTILEQSLKTCPLLSDAAFPDLSKSDQIEQQSSFSKPSVSITTLVLMALQQSKNGKLSFTSICKWIQENFPFYGTCETKLQVIASYIKIFYTN